MKIVHITQYYNDGYSYQENLLPRYQKKMGYDVVIITSDRMSSFINDSSRVVGEGTFIDNEVKVIRLPIYSEFRKGFVFFKGLDSVLEEENPDYIFHHGLAAPSLVTVAKYKMRNPNVYLAVDNHADYHNTKSMHLLKMIYYHLTWKPVIQRYREYVDVFYSVTPGCKVFAERELGIPQSKHELLFLGADSEMFHFDEDWRREIRGELGFTNDDFVMITVGKLDRLKKTDLIVKAMKEMDSEKVKLIIVGSIEKNYGAYLDSLIGDDKRIIKIGWVQSSEIYKYFSASDLAIFPGSQSVLWQQAVACEIPLLIRYTIDSEYLIAAGNGLNIFSDDHKEIKQIISILINNKLMIKEMSEKARFVRDNIFSYEKIAQKSLEIRRA